MKIISFIQRTQVFNAQGNTGALETKISIIQNNLDITRNFKYKTTSMKISELARFVKDVKKSTAFYRTLLGFDPIYADATIAIFKIGDTKLLIHEVYNDTLDGNLPCENHTAFGVPNLDEKFEKLLSKGLNFEKGPKKFDWGYSAYLRDPDGNLIEIEQQTV